MSLSKEEFSEWKSSFATKQFFESVIVRIEDAKDVLSATAGLDSLQDRYIAGMIQAFREVLSTEWEEGND